MKTFDTDQEAIDYSVINPSETVESKSYYYGGQLWEHFFYVNGKRHGEYKSYWRGGKLRGHRFYVNGKLHGESKSYYYDGQLRTHFFYVNGEVFDVDNLLDGSYKSKCILSTLFNGNVIDEDI